RRRHTRSDRDWSSDVCSSDLTREQIGKRIAELQCRQFAQPQAPSSIVSQRAKDLAMIGILKSNFCGLSLGGVQESRILGLLAAPDGLATKTRLFLGHDRLHSRESDRWRHALPVPLAHDPPVLEIHRPDVAGLSQGFSEALPLEAQMLLHWLIENALIHRRRDCTGLCRIHAMCYGFRRGQRSLS